MDLIAKLDYEIKKTWLDDITQDYHNDFILREDALKNSFYYHLRTRLGDGFLKRHLLRIYPEFHTEGYRADLVIAKLHPKTETQGYYLLEDRVDKILAIIEFKYKSAISQEPFLSDVKKARTFIKSRAKHLKDTQLYLGFIHEAVYNEKDCFWLNKKQRESWANNYLTEMVGFYNSDKDEIFETKIISYNHLNTELNFRDKVVG